MLQTLRRAGATLVITIPRAFIEQNGLHEGSQLSLSVDGPLLTIAVPPEPGRSLRDMLAEMPAGLPLAADWERLAPVGREG